MRVYSWTGMCKREHLCVRCGEKLPEGCTEKRCEMCEAERREERRQYDSIYHKQYKQKKDAEKSAAERKKKRKQPTLSISEVNRMAAERGISYGMMVLELQKGLK